MQEWVTLPLAAVSGGVLLSLLIIIIFLSSCRRCHKSSDRLIQQKDLRHHRVTLHRLDKNGDKKTNYFVSLRGPPENPIFRWADHPSLVTEAVENGWSGFGFVACSSSPTSVRRCMSLFRRRQKIHGGDQPAILRRRFRGHILALLDSILMPLFFLLGSAGTRLVGECDSRRWGRAGKVIGIGHNTAQNKVFFTVDSNLLYEIHCESEEFGSPLHPTISAAADEADITVSVNLGQTHFKYAPANLRRTPNPCFTMTEQCPSSSPGLGCGEDSRELFSMGRIDSEWLMIGEGAKSRSIKRGVDDDDLGSDGDLFEIALDGSGKSPNVLRI
ncbi:unnamed protein product [Cuscuta campestris]|uniref:SPRY domain-containing protein n=1 Tax=Cuscuta campestris TaxID=132261 RepID=A0A484KEJ0_9ASTE|nr:unnamed protein product [Cuscuta campestris]